MLETVAGLIRLQFWNLSPNRCSALLFDVTTFYKKNPGMYSEDLLVLNDNLAAGQLNLVLDTTFPLEEGRQALEYLRDGKAKGKVVLLTEAYNT